MTTTQPPHLRSLYRRLLRELPSRKPSILANPSPIQTTIRSQFATTSSTSTSASIPVDAAATEQILQYLKAQRTYMTLVERYNPGMNMTEEDRVRMTARRVGMDLPEELRPGKGSGQS